MDRLCSIAEIHTADCSYSRVGSVAAYSLFIDFSLYLRAVIQTFMEKSIMGVEGIPMKALSNCNRTLFAIFVM